MKFGTEELDQLADALSAKVLQRIKPFMQNKERGNGSRGLLTVDGLSKLLCVPKPKIYNLVHLKRIPYLKVAKALRFRMADVDKWLEEPYTPVLDGVSHRLRGGVERCKGQRV